MLGRGVVVLGLVAEPAQTVLSGATLPNTGVKISMIAFGGLSLLILGAAAFFASRRRRNRS